MGVNCISSAGFSIRALESENLLVISASRQIYALLITEVQDWKINCCKSAYSFVNFLVIVMCIFVFVNIIIEERHFFIFTVFRDNQLISAHLKWTNIFKWFVHNFFIPTANLFIISGSTFCFADPCLIIEINYFLMKLNILIFYGFILD